MIRGLASATYTMATERQSPGSRAASGTPSSAGFIRSPIPIRQGPAQFSHDPVPTATARSVRARLLVRSQT